MKKPSQKSEMKVVPDEKDGTLPFVAERNNESCVGRRTAAPRGERASGFASASEAEPTNQALGQLSVDVFQTPDEIVIVAPVAGVRLSDIVISITDEVLEIKGRRNFEFRVQEGDYFTQECFWGDFARSVILPDAVDASRVSASFKNGILTVRVPKVERIKTRMVRINEEL